MRGKGGDDVKSAWPLWAACSRVINRDIYGDHAVSCAGIVSIKHRHNVVFLGCIQACRGEGELACSYINSKKAAELDAALSKSRDSQSSIFFSPENIGLREGFPSLLTSTDTDR
ncbi:hypothetical protein Tco_0405494 [Tanacetum coccineum]